MEKNGRETPYTKINFQISVTHKYLFIYIRIYLSTRHLKILQIMLRLGTRILILSIQIK